jgi:geranylgeranyl diphosphate synthase, type I
LRRGKRIRPMLFLASYRLFGGDRPLTSPAVLQAAASLELLHTFILIHDDVIDRSETRRGLPTFHKLMEVQLGKLTERERSGQNLALVLGDMLFALAIDTMVCADLDPARRQIAVRKLLQYVADTGCGETYDILLGARDISRVLEAEIEQMYALKTTRYTFEAPLVLGAILAGAEEAAVAELVRVAEPLGLAFQIQNDLQEFSHFDPLDRAMQTDLLEGKKTMLVRVAYDRLSELDRSFFQLCLQAPSVKDSSIIKIKELVDKSGAVAVLQARQVKLLQEAEEILKTPALKEEQRQGVRDIMELIRQTIQGHGSA